jgi:drug/metabolite transporter (DMT)-like permease
MDDIRKQRADLVLHAALLLLAAVIYGAVFPVNRFAAEAGWQPLSFAFQQALFAGLVLAIAGALGGIRPELSGKHLGAYVAIGGLVVGLPMGLLVAAANHLDASVVTLVLCLSPILTLFIGAMLGIETVSRNMLIGMLLGIIGIAVIVIPQSAVLRQGTWGWFLLSLGAPVMFATANNLAKYLRPPATHSLAMASGTLFGAALVSLIVLLLFGERMILPPSNSAQLWPLAAAVTINAAFYVLFFETIRIMGPARFSFFNYLAVAAGVLWSMAVFREQPANLYWVAILIMFGGMYLALTRRTK